MRNRKTAVPGNGENRRREVFCVRAGVLLLSAAALWGCGGQTAGENGGGGGTSAVTADNESSVLAGEAVSVAMSRTEGKVHVEDAADKEVSVLEDMALYDGYKVGTETSSYAWLDLDEERLTKLDEESKVRTALDGKNTRLWLENGSLFFNITEPLAEDETLEIRTSSMVTGIRGTCGWVTQEMTALLEGTVTVTAGEQTVTVSAGEKAVLSADGKLDVQALGSGEIPAFVKEEIGDADLPGQESSGGGSEQTQPGGGSEETRSGGSGQVQSGAGENLPVSTDANAASYEEFLDTLEEEVVYSEVIDFEQDGSLELLVIEMKKDASGAPVIVNSAPSIYRNTADGMERMGGTVNNGDAVRGDFSLAESGGKLFLRSYSESRVYAGDPGTYGVLICYYGPSDVAGGGLGMTDYMHVQYEENGEFYHIWVYPHGEDGFVVTGNLAVSDYEAVLHGPGSAEIYEEVESKYTHVRDLLSYEGADVTLAE